MLQDDRSCRLHIIHIIHIIQSIHPRRIVILFLQYNIELIIYGCMEIAASPPKHYAARGLSAPQKIYTVITVSEHLEQCQNIITVSTFTKILEHYKKSVRKLTTVTTLKKSISIYNVSEHYKH